jgi:hypothetical protein
VLTRHSISVRLHKELRAGARHRLREAECDLVFVEDFLVAVFGFDEDYVRFRVFQLYIEGTVCGWKADLPAVSFETCAVAH